MYLVHPSELADIMTMAKAKGAGPEVLSVGALTFCYEKAKQTFYGYEKELDSKYLDKGIDCEDESIALYNNVFFTNYSKNISRIENDFLTGECDIDTGTKIIDIKTSWSIETFPAMSDRINSKTYEWQGRAYMLLYNRPEFELAYCMISTPDYLCEYEKNRAVHKVDHIPPALRVTTKTYMRDEEKEELIKIKCSSAQQKISEYIEIIKDEHGDG